MKTITFYSYKGGVGRTLALANTAKRLSEFKKKICILDFDLEAPGLHLKFPELKQKKENKLGIVDYMYEYITKGFPPSSLKPYTSIIDFRNNYQSNIHIITAGRTNNVDYWNKLSSLNWNKLFYEPESQGVSFFIDLKEKIKKEFEPDYLLIDSRTGISEVSSISLSLLADEIVLMSAFNEENLGGVGLILKSLVKPENNLLGRRLKFHFVLSRIPFDDYRYQMPSEASLKATVKNHFSPEGVGVEADEIIIIHSDPELEFKETLKIGYENEKKDRKEKSIAFDYLQLFKKIFYEELSIEDLEHFNKISEAENFYERSKNTTNNEEKIKLLNQAINVNPGVSKFYFDRGIAYFQLERYTKAKEDFEQTIKLESTNAKAHRSLGSCYQKLKRSKDALKAFEEAIILDKNDALNYTMIASFYSKLGNYNISLEFLETANKIDPYNSNTLNSIADVYRRMGDLKLASKYVNESLSLNPKNAVAFATLAEIKATLDQIEDFYLFTTIALKLDPMLAEAFLEDEFYKPYLNQERFEKLCESLGVNLKELEETKRNKTDDKIPSSP